MLTLLLVGHQPRVVLPHKCKLLFFKKFISDALLEINSSLTFLHLGKRTLSSGLVLTKWHSQRKKIFLSRFKFQVSAGFLSILDRRHFGTIHGWKVHFSGSRFLSFKFRDFLPRKLTNSYERDRLQTLSVLLSYANTNSTS